MTTLAQQLPRDVDWLDGVPIYQQRVIRTIADESSLLEAAETWLSSSGAASTVPFGTGSNVGSLFLANVATELQKLLCTEVGYEADRENIRAGFTTSHVLVVGLISAALGSTLGVAAVLLVPVIAALLNVITTAGKKTACEKLNEIVVEAEKN